jgi:hypothetical protein
MPRSNRKRLASTRLAILGPGLLWIGLAVAGCADDTPGVGTADMAASRDAAKDKHGGLTNFGARSGDVAPVKTRGKGTGGRPAGPNPDARGQKR